MIIITAVNMITSVLGSILLHYLILRADVLVLSDETLKSRIQLYSIFKIGVTATLMVLILIIFATNTAQSLLEANTTMDKDESQLLYQYAGFSIPFGTQLKDLLGDKIFMVFLIGTNLGIAGIEGIEDSVSFLLLNFDIRLSQARVIKAATMLCAALGIVAYIKLFLMKSHQLFYLLIGNFIM